MTKIISYNVNGIRAAIKKGFISWLKSSGADIICIQETKAMPEQLDLSVFEEAGYRNYWHSAHKKGYSGVAILSKNEPDHVEYGCGMEKYDIEGRVLRADYGCDNGKGFSVMSLYIPSGTSGDERQKFKMQYLDDFQGYVDELKKQIPNLIISGDYNICHQAIDIHDPAGNAQSSGFLPEERQWIGGFIKNGFIDSFRYLNKGPHQYTWWTYRANARERNLGWRIDYNMVSNPLENKIKKTLIFPEVKHSDHCPIFLEMDLQTIKN